MTPDLLVATPAAWMGGVHLGEVTSVADPLGIGRVKLLIPSLHAEAEFFARVAVPFAGADRGAFLIPDVGDEVVVAFIGGDVRHAVVIGSVWNGRNQPPETLPGDAVDRWSLTGKAGTRIAIIEESGREQVAFETPAGVTGILTDEAGGRIRFSAAGVTVTFDTQGVTIESPGPVKVTAPSLEVTAGQITVNSAQATFSGAITCASLTTTSVTSATYSPGAGNVW